MSHGEIERIDIRRAEHGHRIIAQRIRRIVVAYGDLDAISPRRLNLFPAMPYFHPQKGS